MDSVSQLNAFVQRVAHVDPLYVIKRDGHTNPPLFVGSLSAPGFSTVSLFSGAGLASKALVRKFLTERFIQLNAVDFAVDLPPAAVPAVSSDLIHSRVLSVLTTSPVTSSLLRTKLSELGVFVALDRVMFELIHLLREKKVQMELSGMRDTETLFWSLPAPPLFTVPELATILSLLQTMEAAPMPLELQHREKTSPPPMPFVLTSTVFRYDWFSLPEFSTDLGRLSHAVTTTDVRIHRFGYTLYEGAAYQPRHLYFVIPVSGDERSHLRERFLAFKLICKPVIAAERERDILRFAQLRDHMQL